VGFGVGKTKTIAHLKTDAHVGELASLHEPHLGAEPPEQPPETVRGKLHNAGPAQTSNDRASELASRQGTWFKAWWAEYWHRRSKKAAWNVFRKCVKTEERFQVVMAAMRAQKAEMLQREPSKRPYGATWLNGERWEDELAPASATGQPPLRVVL
jgi:hypothetical protein